METWKQKRGHTKTNAEIGMVWPQAKDAGKRRGGWEGGPLEPERGQSYLPESRQRECGLRTP